jgi:hypothetical protein
MARTPPRKRKRRLRRWAEKAVKVLALGVIRRQLRVVRVQVTVGLLAIAGLMAGVRWAWRRRQASEPSAAG